jgi:hypothetical protein
MQKMNIKYPDGYKKADGTTQIAIRFPHALFNQVIEMAKKEERDFNDMVICLVRCGKLCIDESDQFEPKEWKADEQSSRNDSNHGSAS